MTANENIPHDRRLDNTLALKNEGYLFISNRVKEHNSDLFETHLLGQRVICMTGEEAAEMFYNPELFQRNGAAPKRIQKTLFGEDAIQTMDGEEHLHRKQLFMSLMTTPRQDRLANLAKAKWEASVESLVDRRKVVLFDEAKKILCQTACYWAAVPLLDSEIKKRAEDFYSMVDGAGAIGHRYWRGKKARKRTEDWIKDIIEKVRSGNLKVEETSPLYAIAFYKKPNGDFMDAHMASIELINVLRPIVAISTYITFAALALHEHPEYKSKIASLDEDYLDMFAQEVRRFYPFVPFLGAKVRKDFTFKECEFKKGMLVLLDMYGINHDPRIWKEPEEFNPDHFKDFKMTLFNFIPQGGGDPSKTHRCPGEGITVEIMKASIDFLVNSIEYEVPEQDLYYSLVRLPTLPESGFIMSNIKRKTGL